MKHTVHDRYFHLRCCFDKLQKALAEPQDLRRIIKADVNGKVVRRLPEHMGACLRRSCLP